MVIETSEEAKETIRKWLKENDHSIKDVKDVNATFNFEIDYPPGQRSKQQIIQPKKPKGAIFVMNPILISPHHLEGLKKMKPKKREALLVELKKEYIFKENQFEFKFNSDEILSNVIFTYPIFFDGLTKNNMYKALDINFKCHLYLSTVLSDKIGVGNIPTSDVSQMYG